MLKRLGLKKIGAEFILGAIIAPWVIWVTASVFGFQTADAVQAQKIDLIYEMVKDIREDLKALTGKKEE